MNEEELLKKLREAFKLESEERLANISSGLLDLEKISLPDEQKPVLEVVFREAHSLKGAARAVNLIDIETLCQSIESIFAALKQETIPLSPKLFDTLHDSVRVMERVLVSSSDDPSLNDNEEIEQLIHKLKDLKISSQISIQEEAGEKKDREQITGNREQETENREQETEDTEDQTSDCQTKPLISGSVRISTSKLDSLLLDAEELTSLKLVTGQRLFNLRDVLHSFENLRKQWIKIESEYRVLCSQVRKQGTDRLSLPNSDSGPRGELSALAKLLEFIDWYKDNIQSVERSIRVLTKATEQDQRMLSRMTDDLLSDMKRVMMLPFSTLFEVFPIMVRDLSRNQGKEVSLTIQGSEIEIDRRILEEMKDPLIHILRNAVDHGLEETEDRVKQNKPRQGAISLNISQTDGNKVEILISDDGRGIDLERIKEEAVKSGLISGKEMARLRDRDILFFIFQSGISSSKIITEISGRGLGLAIVQEKVEKLGGLLSVDTEHGKGTSFKIQLPVSLVTFRGVLVRAADDLFVVPASYTERVLRIRQDEIKTVENRATIPLNGQVLPLADLAEVLRLETRNSELENRNLRFQNQGFKFPITVIVLGTEQKQIAYRIEEVICEQEVLVKSLGKQLAKVPRIAGATILGTGKAVPILNVHDLLKVQESGSFGMSCQAETTKDRTVNRFSDHRKKASDSKGSVLIAEDSITSRMLIKNILEAAGYSVKTAVDGWDAYSILKTEDFDAVVSDVEMPRMDGFELTKKIRDNARLAETPVVLVTSLDSREDRERGIDVGADAYIVKSSFDQSNLLEVIDRLI